MQKKAHGYNYYYSGSLTDLLGPTSEES